MEGEERWNGAAGGHETGSQAEPARVRGGRGTSLQAGPAACAPGVRSGPCGRSPARASSWRPLLLCGRGRGRARGRRRVVRGPAAGCSQRREGERLEGERERREGIRLEGFTRA